MKKQSSEFNKVIGAVMERVKKLESFTVSQLPDLCKELLLETRVIAAAATSVSATILVGSVLGIVHTHRDTVACTVAHGDPYMCDHTGLMGVYAVLLSLSLIGFVAGGLELLSSLVAPKLTILRKLKSLIEGG